MTFPDLNTMFLLFSLHTGQKLGVDPAAGELTIDVPGAGPVAIPSLESGLTGLESRGWVAITKDGPEVTEQGRYAARRFFRARGVDIDLYQLTMRATRTGPV